MGQRGTAGRHRVWSSLHHFRPTLHSMQAFQSALWAHQPWSNLYICKSNQPDTIMTSYFSSIGCPSQFSCSRTLSATPHSNALAQGSSQSGMGVLQGCLRLRFWRGFKKGRKKRGFSAQALIHCAKGKLIQVED